MKTNDPDKFYKAVFDWQKITWNKVNRIIKGVSADLFASIVGQTPVDTGRTKASWNFSTDVPNYTVQGATTKKGKARSFKASTTRGDTVMKNKVLRSNVQLKKRKDVLKFYLTNGNPHINMLEYGLYPSPSKTGKTVGGFSIRARGGFVRKNLNRFENININKYALRGGS